MKEFQYVIKDSVGLHARPAGLLVKEAAKGVSTITIFHGDKKADAKKLLALMGMGIKCGDTVTFQIEGADEEECAERIQKFCEENV